MNVQQYSTLTQNVNLLGQILGDTLKEAGGPELLAKVEAIRLLSKSARSGSKADEVELKKILKTLTPDELILVSRAFNQFLNLANIADQHHTISREMDEEFSATKTLARGFDQLLENGQSPEAIATAVTELNIALVLTAHPTEITRRTLIDKYSEIDDCLGRLELAGLTERERAAVLNRLRDLIAQIWHTEDFRCERPTPVDEAKWGFAVVENSLWHAVPDFVRRVDKTYSDATGKSLPLEYTPVSFASWMGGDRDGNPNVTAKVTAEVLLLSRWQAASLYLNDVNELIAELSMSACNQTLRDLYPATREPYRHLLRSLRTSLKATLANINAQLQGDAPVSDGIILSEDQLWQPLLSCYQSLLDAGLNRTANGKLLDLLRRVRCFGVHLVKLDVRQESDRHTEVLSELTQHLGLGDYGQWDEAQKQQFLVAELANKRPLIPANWQPSASVQEVLDSCAVVAANRPALGCYIISMARQASDILAVELLLKVSGLEDALPVAPLFETLDDLNRSSAVLDQLLAIESYKQHLNGRLMVMIGYSDSAKDAGVLAASWAQYRAQEGLIERAAKADIKLTLFHGRGGTIGRGGAPAHEALLSQPPGSLAQGLRVTEQGEMIRTKLGLRGLATKTLALYASAILQANLNSPPVPSQAWRDVMDKLSDSSCDIYRGYVKHDESFVQYFREATPEQELTKLPLGSRPARRKASGGISSLRAIPWIFAWMQNRLMLPAWLGAGQAMASLDDDAALQTLKGMAQEWPFFATRISMLEMVFAKADVGLSAYYDDKLVPKERAYIGEQLRNQVSSDIETVLSLLNKQALLEGDKWAAQSIKLRNIYTDPLNYLQAELLDRYRQAPEPNTEQAIMVTIAGIAAGMRNTG